MRQTAAMFDAEELIRSHHFKAYEALQRVSVETGYSYRLVRYRLDYTAPLSVYEDFMTPVQGIIKFAHCHTSAMNQFAGLLSIISEQSPISTPDGSFHIEELTLYVTPFGNGFIKGDEMVGVTDAILRQLDN